MERSKKELSLAALGLLSILEDAGSADFATLAMDHDDFSMFIVENLVDCGFASADEEKVYFLEGDISGLKAEFNRFRVAYPGMKDGEDVMFNYFRKKNKKWRSIIPRLMPNLERQIAERTTLKAIIDQKEKAFDRAHGLHLPSWLNLKTYLGNEGWTRQYYEAPAPKEPQRSLHSMNDAYNKYRFWAMAQSPDILPSEIDPKILSESQFMEWVEKAGAFAGIEFDLSIGARKQFFDMSHKGYLGDAKLQRQFASVYNYMMGEVAKMRNL